MTRSAVQPFARRSRMPESPSDLLSFCVGDFMISGWWRNAGGSVAAQQPRELNLPAGGREQIVAADHVRDALHEVVDGGDELVGPVAGAVADEQVAALLGRLLLHAVRVEDPRIAPPPARAGRAARRRDHRRVHGRGRCPDTRARLALKRAIDARSLAGRAFQACAGSPALNGPAYVGTRVRGQRSPPANTCTHRPIPRTQAVERL